MPWLSGRTARMDADEPLHDAGAGRRGRARMGLALFVASTALCVAVAVSPDPAPRFVPSDSSPGDIDVYRQIVERVRAGEPFYDVCRDELRKNGYPTRSVFNWRTPMY